jgi:type IV pilus assembly protein PilN
LKPIHLNLASRPYRDYTPVNLVAAAMFVLMLVLAWFNIDTFIRYNVDKRNTRAKIAQLEAQQRREKELEQSAQTRLASIDIKFLDEQTRFINAKLAERAFSWSALLDDLESVLPQDVRLVSVAPSFDKDSTVRLSLTFQTKTNDGMIRTINRMHQDPQFLNPFPNNESMIDGGMYAFDLNVIYRPASPMANVPARAEVTR